MAATAALFSTSLLPVGAHTGSISRSMSKAPGWTVPPPVNGDAAIPTSMPPVAANRQSPEGVCAACSWYCQRVATDGCQHAPADVSHGTGAGQPAVAQVAAAGSAATTSSTKASTFASIVAASP